MSETLQAVPDLPDIPSQTQADYLALMQRILPAHYLVPLQEPGPGYELLQAYAAIGERIAQAVARIANGNYIATAQEGAYSEGTIEFFRATAIWGAFTLQAGTIVGTDDGYTYVTTAPAEFGALDLGPHTVAVRATVRGWLYNKPGPVVLEDGTVLQGPITRLIQPVLTTASPNFDPTVQVRQLTATVGGVSPMLDGIGADRGVIRADGESADDYRLRMFLLPRTVTPNSVQELVTQIIGPELERLGLPWWLYEGWDERVQMCWDAPINETFDAAELHDLVPEFNANIFVWDWQPTTTDAYQPGSWTNTLMSSSDYGASLLIGLPNVPELFGLYAGLAQNLAQAKPAGVPVYYLIA